MNKSSQLSSNLKNRLTPVTSEWMKRLMAEPDVINSLLEEYGSPVNILHPDSFHNNSLLFQQLFKNNNIKGKIFYARKANKAVGFALQSLASGIGIDTASLKELQQCLTLGIPGKKLVLTAAVKNKELIQLAIQNNVTIIIDNAEECQLIQEVANNLNKKAIVGLRLSGFSVNSSKLYSRFGFAVDSVRKFLREQFIENNLNSQLELTGLHFHLDGYSIPQRGEALLQSIELFRWLKDEGFPMEFIDIGGGILVNYLQHRSEWELFNKRLKQSILGEQKPVTFRNDGLGYRFENNKITGTLNTYPYYNDTGSVNFLSKLFAYNDSESVSVSDHLRKNQIELRIEPGRAMLNQAGITIARVAHRKKDTEGRILVGLEMNMSQMNSSSDDFLLDPFVIYQTSETLKNNDVELYFTGAYCLEGDLILKRKITLPELPAIGDKVIFVNTAGYMMHFYERQSHLLPFSENLIFTEREEGISDSDFQPDNQIIEQF